DRRAHSAVLLSMSSHPLRAPHFRYTTLFRARPSHIPDAPRQSQILGDVLPCEDMRRFAAMHIDVIIRRRQMMTSICIAANRLMRSEGHTSELQSRFDVVCRLLIEKRNDT